MVLLNDTMTFIRLGIISRSSDASNFSTSLALHIVLCFIVTNAMLQSLCINFRTAYVCASFHLVPYICASVSCMACFRVSTCLLHCLHNHDKLIMVWKYVFHASVIVKLWCQWLTATWNAFVLHLTFFTHKHNTFPRTYYVLRFKQ